MEFLLLFMALIPTLSCTTLVGYDCEKGPLNIGLWNIGYSEECTKPTIPTRDCDLLKKGLEAVSKAPDNFAYHLKHEPGWMVASAENIIYVIECIPTKCEIRNTEESYSGIPVTCRNESLFLTPQSRIIARKSSKDKYNLVLPTKYRVENQWYTLTPSPIQTLPLNPGTKILWKDVDYPSVETTFGNKALQTLDKIINWYASFADYCSMVFRWFVVICIIKFIIDTVTDGLKLYRAHGWGLHMVRAPCTASSRLRLFIVRILVTESHAGIPSRSPARNPVRAQAEFERPPAHERSFAKYLRYLL